MSYTFVQKLYIYFWKNYKSFISLKLDLFYDSYENPIFILCALVNIFDQINVLNEKSFTSNFEIAWCDEEWGKWFKS